MKKYNLPVKNNLNPAAVLKLLKEVRAGKAKIILGCPVLDYSTALIRKYNRHYFIIVYTERNFWRYGNLINAFEAVEVITQGIGKYKGMKLGGHFFVHPEEKDRYKSAEVIENLRHMFRYCKGVLKNRAFLKGMRIKVKEINKQLALF
jgi:hypothetical protein